MERTIGFRKAQRTQKSFEALITYTHPIHQFMHIRIDFCIIDKTVMD